MTHERLEQLVKLFKSSSTLIVEYDLHSDLSSKPSLSLGKYYPQNTIYIRSYLKAYGPDLSLAVLSASNQIVEQIQDIRSVSIGWTSRLLQNALAWLMNNPKPQQQLKDARETYAHRHNMLVDALKKRGINVPYSNDGHNLWLKVPSEANAVELMAKNGILVLAGKHFGSDDDYIRISTGQLNSGVINIVADTIALVLRSPFVIFKWRSI